MTFDFTSFLGRKTAQVFVKVISNIQNASSQQVAVVGISNLKVSFISQKVTFKQNHFDIF